MNFPLAFPDPQPELPGFFRRDNRLESALTQFEQLAAREDSPITAIRRQPARSAQFVPFPASISPALVEALARRGIRQLYSHQAAAFEAIAAGKNLVVVTPTASGKTLCYNLPVLQRLLEEPAARALYLFPTKALAEDQLHEFNSIVEDLSGGDGPGAAGKAPSAPGHALRAFTYDGDTPQDARRAIRERANVVLSNPDMLHSGILPHHTRWAKLFENLRYVVVDEMHTCRGVFGSHVANVLRRLQRICAFYGSQPQFICCSATIANPGELAERLLEAPVEVLDASGAPSGEKYVVFYNPPVVNRQLGIRKSYIHETRNIARGFIDRGQQTLVFANNRLATEVLVTYLKDACERGPRGVPAASVRGYRGGYLPKERRAIERGLREGEIRAVVSTNALELGIDIGSLDVVVLAGYPGTIASTWQRAGRAGRRAGLSAAVLVASSAPLDQYIIEHPDYFFDRSPEHAYINPDNLEILVNHLKCAAFELPIRDGEAFGASPALRAPGGGPPSAVPPPAAPQSTAEVRDDAGVHSAACLHPGAGRLLSAGLHPVAGPVAGPAVTEMTNDGEAFGASLAVRATGSSEPAARVGGYAVLHPIADPAAGAAVAQTANAARGAPAGERASLTAEMCRFLEELGVVHHAGGAWHWTSESYPADAISLRSVTSDNFVVVDITAEPKVIAEVDFPSALTTLHEKAIYLHEARQYQVERFDYDERKAYARSVNCDYFTDAIDYTQVKILDTFSAEPVGDGEASASCPAPDPIAPGSPVRAAQPSSAAGPLADAALHVHTAEPAAGPATRAHGSAAARAIHAHGEVRINRQIVGFKKIKFYTLENVGAGQLTLPEQEMHTTSFWLSFPQAFLARFPDLNATEKQAGLAGLGNALRTVASVLLMCDPHDLGVAVGENAPGALATGSPVSAASSPLGSAATAASGVPATTPGFTASSSSGSAATSPPSPSASAATSSSGSAAGSPPDNAPGNPSGGAALFEPYLYLYDNYPGGIGQSEPLDHLCAELLGRARQLLEACPCEAGCPSCVGPIGEVGERGKEAALRMLAAMIEP